jgi:methionine synthase II (cobalamin-independent)
MSLTPFCASAPTVVGSFPHQDAQALVGRLLSRLRDIPAWPQLPVRDWRESMYVQCSEGLPGAVVDQTTQRIYFRIDDGFPSELERFYQAVVEEDVDRFAISRDYALGLHAFLDQLRQPGQFPSRAVKGQVVGPFSFAMTVTDENKRSMAYTPELHEVAVQGVAMKARWMARTLRQIADHALVVLDEPYLCSFGSAFVNVSRDDVIAAIDTAAAAIHAEGARAGLHCCGNTDWSLVFATAVDVVNFDAYAFFQGLPLYPAELTAFLQKGGTLAWGIVPTSGATEDLSAPTLIKALDDRVDQLAAKGIDRGLLERQAIVTPSCGMGTLSPEIADRVLDVLVELADRLHERNAA